MAKMIGATKAGKSVSCDCCIAPSWRATLKRGVKRSERNEVKRMLSNPDNY